MISDKMSASAACIFFQVCFLPAELLAPSFLGYQIYSHENALKRRELDIEVAKSH